MSSQEKVRERIEELTDRIYGVADLLCLLAEFDEETQIKPRTVACAGRIIAHDIMNLSCYLEELNITGVIPEHGEG